MMTVIQVPHPQQDQIADVMKKLKRMWRWISSSTSWIRRKTSTKMVSRVPTAAARDKMTYKCCPCGPHWNSCLQHPP